MKHKQLLIGGVLLGGAVLLSSPLVRERLQTDLKAKVEQKLASAEPAGRFQDVQVADVDHMDVEIAGSVRTEQDRRDVKPTVQSVPGVGRVTGDVAVHQPSVEDPTTEKDDPVERPTEPDAVQPSADDHDSDAVEAVDANGLVDSFPDAVELPQNSFAGDDRSVTAAPALEDVNSPNVDLDAKDDDLAISEVSENALADSAGENSKEPSPDNAPKVATVESDEVVTDDVGEPTTNASNEFAANQTVQPQPEAIEEPSTNDASPIEVDEIASLETGEASAPKEAPPTPEVNNVAVIEDEDPFVVPLDEASETQVQDTNDPLVTDNEPADTLEPVDEDPFLDPTNSSPDNIKAELDASDEPTVKLTDDEPETPADPEQQPAPTEETEETEVVADDLPDVQPEASSTDIDADQAVDDVAEQPVEVAPTEDFQTPDEPRGVRPKDTDASADRLAVEDGTPTNESPSTVEDVPTQPNPESPTTDFVPLEPTDLNRQSLIAQLGLAMGEETIVLHDVGHLTAYQHDGEKPCPQLSTSMHTSPSSSPSLEFSRSSQVAMPAGYSGNIAMPKPPGSKKKATNCLPKSSASKQSSRKQGRCLPLRRNKDARLTGSRRK